MSTERSAAAGTFFFVVGPSGAGKDTLIDGARQALAGRPYVFARRVITRPAGAAGEDHEAETAEGFERRRAAGDFLMTWRAHGLDYGLPASLLGVLAAGSHVVANGSRAMVATLAERLPGLVVVEVCAPPEVLARRIAGRGRETAQEVLARLARQVDPLPTGLLRQRVVNDGDPAQGIARFLQVLSQPVTNRVVRRLGLDTGGESLVLAPCASWPAASRLRLQGPAGALADVRVLARMHPHEPVRMRAALQANVQARVATCVSAAPQDVLAEVAPALQTGELGLPSGLMQRLGLDEGQTVRVLPTLEASSRTWLGHKLRGGRLTASEYEAVFLDALDGRYTEAELTAFLVATTRALDADETLALAQARTRLAKPMVWDEAMVVDKHSLGGVPGSRITLVVVPIVAAHGLAMPCLLYTSPSPRD